MTKPQPYYLSLHTTNSGFTLIELLIVVTLSIMLLLGASTMFMTFLISNSKLSASQLVKNEGNYAINQIEFLIRNAVEIIPNSLGQKCETNMSEISFISIDGGQTTLTAEADPDDNNHRKIASNSGIFLTSNSVDLTAGPVFNCTQPSDGQQQYVEVSFSVRKGTPGVDLNRDIVAEDFSTGVAVRSF